MTLNQSTGFYPKREHPLKTEWDKLSPYVKELLAYYLNDLCFEFTREKFSTQFDAVWSDDDCFSFRYACITDKRAAEYLGLNVRAAQRHNPGAVQFLIKFFQLDPQVAAQPGHPTEGAYTMRGQMNYLAIEKGGIWYCKNRDPHGTPSKDGGTAHYGETKDPLFIKVGKIGAWLPRDFDRLEFAEIGHKDEKLGYWKNALKPRDRLVYGLIQSYLTTARAKGQKCVSNLTNKRIAQSLALTEKTVERAIQTLRRATFDDNSMVQLKAGYVNSGNHSHRTLYTCSKVNEHPAAQHVADDAEMRRSAEEQARADDEELKTVRTIAKDGMEWITHAEAGKLIGTAKVRHTKKGFHIDTHATNSTINDIETECGDLPTKLTYIPDRYRPKIGVKRVYQYSSFLEWAKKHDLLVMGFKKECTEAPENAWITNNSV